MVIADLNHLNEAMSEEANTLVSGISSFLFPWADAQAAAYATSIGFHSATISITETASVSGLFSKSNSLSRSTAEF